MPESTLITRMQQMVSQWEEDSDQRAIFLKCYQRMTENMLQALNRQEFIDPIWVNQLLQKFSGYYFTALHAYEVLPASAPRVWQIAHDHGRNPDTWALQKLLLGVNAHINYDLILVLADLLSHEWDDISRDLRETRHADYLHVNEIIGRTIDIVQDEILEPAMPLMELIDRIMVRGDELVVSRLLVGWRDKVWDRAILLLKAKTTMELNQLVNEAELNALRIAKVILLNDSH